MDAENQNQDQQTTSTEQNTEVGDQSTEVNNETENQSQNQNQNQPDQNIIALYDNVLREKEAELQRLRDQLTAQPQTPPTPPPTAEEQRQRFFNNPMDVLREEIQTAVSPLLEFTKGIKKETEYDRLKNKYKADPRYTEVFPHIEGYVDQIMSRSEVNDANIRTAILVAIGALHSGEISSAGTSNGSSPQNRQPLQNNNQPKTVVTPPHLRSTPPAAPKSNKSQQAPVLTELEKRLAREKGMSPEEYVKFRDAKAGEVLNVG